MRELGRQTLPDDRNPTGKEPPTVGEEVQASGELGIKGRAHVAHGVQTLAPEGAELLNHFYRKKLPRFRRGHNLR
jgi:hypothetical protein